MVEYPHAELRFGCQALEVQDSEHVYLTVEQDGERRTALDS